MSEPQDLWLLKQSLRDAAKKQRALLSKAQRAVLGEAITQRFFTLQAYKDASLLLTYISIGAEPDTSAIMEAAWASGKLIAAPRCGIRRIDLDFYLIRSRADLITGAWGIPEPDVQKCEKLTELGCGLCLVPALLCDELGRRLGYGKGYYDRFLSRFGGESAILAYELSVSPSPLPHWQYDRRSEYVVTEKRIINTGKKEALRG